MRPQPSQKQPQTVLKRSKTWPCGQLGRTAGSRSAAALAGGSSRLGSGRLACRAGARSSRNSSRETRVPVSPPRPAAHRNRPAVVSFVSRSTPLPRARKSSCATASCSSASSSLPVPCRSQWLNHASSSVRPAPLSSSGASTTDVAPRSSPRRSAQKGATCAPSSSSVISPSWPTSKWSRKKRSTDSPSTGSTAAKATAASERLIHPSASQSMKRMNRCGFVSEGASSKPSTTLPLTGLRPPSEARSRQWGLATVARW
mmetsp:Transcript_84504/g.273664  ORF Transcript_84504/g.273664 Transcript_84504/m.273664 type:complete len:258 (-) Transcript_84504:66-839(-)